MNVGKLILLAVAAIAVGGIVFLALSGGNEDTPITQIVPKQEKVEMSNVLVTDVAFERGQVIDPTLTKWIEWPTKLLPENFVTDEQTEFFNSLGEARARSFIAEGEPLFEAKLIRQGDRSLMSALIQPGMNAVSVNINPESGTAGFVLPGDRVDVYTTGDVEGEDGETNSILLYSDVRVLAIDQVVGQASTGAAAIVGRTATLELAPNQVSVMLINRQDAEMTLVLRSSFTPDEEKVFDGDILPQVTRFTRS